MGVPAAPAKEKTFLAVPYKEKEQAKKFGAKWDKENKLWYAPEGTDLARLAAWLPEKARAPEPLRMLSPQEEFAQALEKAGLKVSDLDLIEANEAFAAQALAVSHGLGLDPAKTNPNGGAIALGHPVGATGAVIVTKLLHEMQRVKARYGLATMCIGGGQGITTIWERA